MTGRWTDRGRIVDPSKFGELSPEEVIVDIGYPLLFTSRNSDGAHLLVFHAEEVTQPDYRQRHVAAPTTEQTLKGLRRGEVSMRDALTASWMWLIEHDESGQPVGAAEITLSDLPDNLLPSPTTMISAELEPALILKFEGADIRDGNVPASIIKAAGEAVQASLREITDFLAGQSDRTQGRRLNRYRQLYNLPAQRIAFGSLEIAFRRPEYQRQGDDPQGRLINAEDEPVSTEEMERQMWSLLQRGLRWTDSDKSIEQMPADSDPERLVIVRAMEKLTPATDAVEEVVIGGKMVATKRVGEPYRLDRDKRTRVLNTKRQLEIRLKTSEQVAVFHGLVRALDIDMRTFILRTQRQIDEGELEGTPFVLVEDEELRSAQEVNHIPQRMAVSARRVVSPSDSNPPWEVLSRGITASNEQDAEPGTSGSQT